jgi:hypothetical protein
MQQAVEALVMLSKKPVFNIGHKGENINLPINSFLLVIFLNLTNKRENLIRRIIMMIPVLLKECKQDYKRRKNSNI